MRAEDDADAARVEMPVDRVGDLSRHPLLHLQAMRKAVHQARELADADDFAGQVTDARLAVERQQMMLARRVERDAAKNDQLIARFVEGPLVDLGGIFAITGRHLAPRANDAGGRIGEALTRGVLADEPQNRGHCLLGVGLISEVKNRCRNAHGTALYKQILA